MFSKLTIVFIVFLATNLQSSCNAVKTPNELSRIAFGVDSSIKKHPYIVGVSSSSWGDCGGSLISSSCVLTAAHCVTNTFNGHPVPKNDLKIRGGTTIFGKDGYVRYVKDYRVAESYSIPTSDMDVAVIKLKKPMKGEYVTTIEIDYGYENNNGNDLIAVGWGWTEYTSEASEHLKEANVTSWSREKCQLGFDLSSTIFGSSNWTITENMLCATGANRNGVCKGDSGGLLIQNGKQVGIPSFVRSVKCGWSVVPDVYTNLKSHQIQQFLNKTTQEFNCWG